MCSRYFHSGCTKGYKASLYGAMPTLVIVGVDP